MFVFSSRGPREDGGFKPNISAPGAAVSTIPTWQPAARCAGTYALPPGYGMFNGTSMAAPQAAGAAALLISAAKQTAPQREARASSGRRSTRAPAFIADFQAPRAGQRPHATSAPPGTCSRRTTSRPPRSRASRAGQHDPQRLPRDAESGHRASTSVRAGRRRDTGTRTITLTRQRERHRPSAYNL